MFLFSVEDTFQKSPSRSLKGFYGKSAGLKVLNFEMPTNVRPLYFPTTSTHQNIS